MNASDNTSSSQRTHTVDTFKAAFESAAKPDNQSKVFGKKYLYLSVTKDGKHEFKAMSRIDALKAAIFGKGEQITKVTSKMLGKMEEGLKKVENVNTSSVENIGKNAKQIASGRFSTGKAETAFNNAMGKVINEAPTVVEQRLEVKKNDQTLDSGGVMTAETPKRLAALVSNAQARVEVLNKEIDECKSQKTNAKTPEEKKEISGKIAQLEAERRELNEQISLRPHLEELIAGKVALVPEKPVNAGNQVTDQPPSNVSFNNYGLKPDPGTFMKFRKATVKEERPVKGEKGKTVEKDVPGYEVTLMIDGKERTLKCPEHTICIAKASDPEKTKNPSKLAEKEGAEEFEIEVEEGMLIYSASDTAVNNDVGFVSEEANGAQVMTFCDGCGWKKAAQNAATIGSSVAQNYVSSELPRARNLRDVARIMLNGMARAHEGIENLAKTNPKEVRDTTYNQVVIADGYAVIAAVGDPKTFIIRDGKAIDVTAGGRGNLHDASDSGGRIGVSSEGESTADFHNMGLYVVKLEPGDVIMVCSDGIHDNLDPETTGLTLAEAAKFCGMDPAPEGDWKTADQDKVRALKKDYMENKVAEVVKDAGDPADAVKMLQQHAASISTEHKLGLLQGRAMIEGDYTRYAGKPDHGGAIAVKYNPKAAAE